MALAAEAWSSCARTCTQVHTVQCVHTDMCSLAFSFIIYIFIQYSPRLSPCKFTFNPALHDHSVENKSSLIWGLSRNKLSCIFPLTVEHVCCFLPGLCDYPWASAGKTVPGRHRGDFYSNRLNSRRHHFQVFWLRPAAWFSCWSLQSQGPAVRTPANLSRLWNCNRQPDVREMEQLCLQPYLPCCS